jgi:hypothetical protein
LLKQQGRADWKWLCNFMCRHPRLGLREPQVTSIARLQGFTKINVAKFFDIFEPALRLINFYSHRLFNYEETGLIVLLIVRPCILIVVYVYLLLSTYS